MDEVEAYAYSHRTFSFRDLLKKQASKVQVIVTFLAILELMKIGKICISQRETFGEIYIETCPGRG